MSLFTQTGIFTGAVMLHVMTSSRRSGCRSAKSIDVGNKIDVDELDFLDFVADDPGTKVIGFYIESIRQSARVPGAGAGGAAERSRSSCSSRAARRMVPRPPPRIPARSPRTTRSSMARCASTASRAPRTRTSSSMRCARSSCCRSRRGKRVGIATTSGALGVISTDLIVQNGLEPRAFEPATLASHAHDPAGLARAGEPLRLLDRHRCQRAARGA